MQIQLKVVLLTGLSVLCAVGIITWRATSAVKAETAVFISEASEKQLAPVRRLVRSKLETSREQLIAFARGKERGLPQPSFGDFDVIGLAFEGENKTWTPKWIDKSVDAKAGRWEASKEWVLARSLPYANVKDGEMYWVWRLDSSEGALFAVMVSVQVESPQPAPVVGGLPEATTTAPAAGSRRGVVVGFFSENPLAAVSEDFIGSMNSVYILDDLGYVASHSTKSYNGSRFSEDEVYKEIRSSSRASGTGNFESLESQKIAARWERVERTNLHAVIATPNAAAGALAAGLTNQLVTAGILVFAFALAAALLLGGRWAGALRDMQRFALEWKAGNFQPGFLNVHRLDEIGDVNRALAILDGNLPAPSPVVSEPKRPSAPQVTPQATSGGAVDTESAYRQMALGLTSAMREPVATILGNIQLLISKASNGEIGEHADAIEREARRLRGVLDSLTRVAGDDELRLSPIAPLDTFELAIAAVDRELTQNGVKLELELEEAPQINGSPVHLQKAIEALLRQGIEAMRTRAKKQLAIKVNATPEGKVRLTIRDTGLGLDQDQVARYFEPFHQPYEGARETELSLAMARATLERHLAEVDVDSSPGEGTSVRIEFPPFSRPSDRPHGRAKSEDSDESKRSLQPPPLPDAFFAVPAPVPPPPNPISQSSLTTLGGKAAISADSAFPPPPPGDGIQLGPLDLSRTAPPKPGESLEVAMPEIEIPSDVEIVVPSSPGKVLQMPNRMNGNEASEFDGSGSEISIARLSFEEPIAEPVVPPEVPEALETIAAGQEAPKISFSMDDVPVAPFFAPEEGPVSKEESAFADVSAPPAPPLGEGGSGILNIEVPSSFLDDEPESFQSVVLGNLAESAADSEVNDDPTTVSSPARRSPTIVSQPSEPFTQAGANWAGDGTSKSVSSHFADSSSESVSEPAFEGDGGFRVKIRRPKTKG